MHRLPETNNTPLDLQLASLQAAYASAAQHPRDLLGKVLARCELGRARIWAARCRFEQIDEQLDAATKRQMRGIPQPLLGIPFAVQDTIHCAGWPTSLGVPGLYIKPADTAPLVSHLMQLGAILIGKTQLEPFGVGWMGMRREEPDGASASSALAVALGLVSFAIATDSDGLTCASAARHQVVALKARREQLCRREIVLNCPSVESLCIIANSVDDAVRIFDSGRDAAASQPGSEGLQRSSRSTGAGSSSDSGQRPADVESHAPLRVGVSPAQQLTKQIDEPAQLAFARITRKLNELSWESKAVDLSLFHEASRLLQQGPWVAERYIATRPWLDSAADTLGIELLERLAASRTRSATEAFEAQHQQQEMQRDCDKLWRQVDSVLLPLTSVPPPARDIDVGLEQREQGVGVPTHFSNLLDLCTLSIPAARAEPSRPFALTLVAAPGAENRVFEAAARLHRAVATTIGLHGVALAPAAAEPSPLLDSEPRLPRPRSSAAELEVALVGARDEPLQSQLLSLGGRFTRRARTAARYELFALAGSLPQQPALIRRSQPAGSIELEVFSLPAQHFGRLVMLLSWPLCIGNIELEDGSWIHGFLCEPQALVGARDVTKYGSWSKALR